jgi:DNA gyrase/topoisomerase IV subunit A
MVISAMGTVLRTPVSSVSVQGRAAQGVAFMNLRAGDRIACVALLNGHGQGPDEDPEPASPPRSRTRAPRGETNGPTSTTPPSGRSTRTRSQTPPPDGTTPPRPRRPRA